MLQLSANEDWREVCRCIIGHGVRQLAIFAVKDPCVNERGNCKEGPVVYMRSEDRDSVWVSWFIYWNDRVS